MVDISVCVDQLNEPTLREYTHTMQARLEAVEQDNISLRMSHADQSLQLTTAKATHRARESDLLLQIRRLQRELAASKAVAQNQPQHHVHFASQTAMSQQQQQQQQPLAVQAYRRRTAIGAPERFDVIPAQLGIPASPLLTSTPIAIMRPIKLTLSPLDESSTSNNTMSAATPNGGGDAGTQSARKKRRGFLRRLLDRLRHRIQRHRHTQLCTQVSAPAQ